MKFSKFWSSEWADLTECESQLQFRENVTCSVTGLQSYTEYQVRVRERCTNFIYDSDWGLSDPFFTSMPIQAGLPTDVKLVPNSVTAFFFDVSWMAGAPGQCIFKEWVMEVYQTSPEPESWALPPLIELLDEPQKWVRHKCVASRENAQCRPGDLPRSLKQNSTYSVRVKESCTDPNADGEFVMLDVNVTTIIALVPAEPPENLTVSNETAYTFLLEFDAGMPNDCYFTGWGVEVRENWTFDANFSNETNYTELNYSLWVPREECKEEEVFPRNRMRCVVPRLRKHSSYDAKVQETCYVGYTLALDSEFSEDLPNRQAETEVPVAATTPFSLQGSEPGPYSFKLQWSPGDPKDCLYMKWLVEIRDSNYTGGEWREAIECGRADRSVTSCTITMLHEGYLGEEAHLRSNTQYEVRVTEACETYTSIYDPWGGSRERAAYLDSPVYYLPSNALPRTLVPVPTLTPTNFRVYDIDHESFRLGWEAPVSNDCRFRNWTVEIQLAIHCISGDGYTNCTDVVGAPWIIPSSCIVEERSITSCQVTGLKSYSFYNVKMRERCSDGTAESADATLVAEIWPFLANVPENLTIVSPEPFTLNLKWDPGRAQECVFSHWDVQVQGRRFGDLVDRFSRESVTEKWYGEILDLENNTDQLNWSSTVASCRLEGQREVAECNVSGLVSNALYDVRIAERCVDSRADSPWVVDRLKATIPAWALTPIGPNVTNVTMTTMDLEWAANEPRDCLFQSWKVEVKPVAISLEDAWIPVPECSLPDRSATSCRIVGLQTYTSYDLRVQETCIHNTSNSPYLLDESSFTTQVGTVVYVGTNPDTNSKPIFFGSQKINACAYHTKCCQDEFSLCYGTDQAGTLATDAFFCMQDLYLSCVDDPVPEDDMKRIVAQPPATLEAVERTANSLSLVWLPFGSGGYMSDCYCSVWNIFLRRQGTADWLLSPECNTMPFSQSSCTVNELEGNWLYPDTVYEVRVRQTCSFDRLSSPYVEIQVPTLPGCTFSQHSGRDDFFVCADGFESNIFEGGRFDGDGIGCWQRGGRATCAQNYPYMCASPDSCAKVTSSLEGGDHCCMREPCGSMNGGDRVCIVRPRPPVDLVVTSSTPDSLNIDWKEQDFTDPTFYPCSFRRWQVDLSRYFFEHWSSDWAPAPECYIEDRRTTFCTVSGLVSNALYSVRIREVCEDELLNGDYETLPTLAQVNPLPATPVTGLYDVQREPNWVLVAWTAGTPNDCVHAGWQVTAVGGTESHSFTSDGLQRDISMMNMTGLTDGVTFEVSVTEMCVNPLANSQAVVLITSSKPEAAGSPVQPTVSAAGAYWLALEWQAGPKGRCDFLHWDIQARKTGTEMFYSAAVCTEQPETTPSCNVTETFACYKDKRYVGFYSVCIPGVECPVTNIENVTACEILCSLQPACRALRFQAAYNHCYLIDSSYLQLDEDPLHQGTGCARNLGLESLSGYELQVSQRCQDPEADSSFVTVVPGQAPNHTTIAPATQPEDVSVQQVVGMTIRLSFTPGALRDYMSIRSDGPLLEMDDSTDCVFRQWSFQVVLNRSEAPSDGPLPCEQYPMVCDQVWHTLPSYCSDNIREIAWCDVKVFWSQELYQLRMREECLDPAADSPYIAEPIWVTSGIATPAQPVANFTSFVEIVDYNISVTFDWEAGEDNDCIFTGWELQLRVVGIDARKEDVNCTISEGILSQTTYDGRVRAFCLDPLSKSNWTEVMEMFTTPAIPADAPLISLLTMGPHELWFSVEPKELRDCIFMGFVTKFEALGTQVASPEDGSESSDMESVNETVLCMPQHREETQCMLKGLQSNTTYYVQVCEYCRNRAAESCGDATNTTALLAPDPPWNIQVSRMMDTARVSFASGMGRFRFKQLLTLHPGWTIQYFNMTWHPLGVCPRNPGAGSEQQCTVDVSSLELQQSYNMRVQEICSVDVLVPFVAFQLPAFEVVAPKIVEMVEMMSNMSNISNATDMEDWDEMEPMLNSSNMSNRTWSEGMEMDKMENVSLNLTGNDSWKDVPMQNRESGHDVMNGTYNESADDEIEDPRMNMSNMSALMDMYENHSFSDSENESANASGNNSIALAEPAEELAQQYEQSVGAQSRSSCQGDCSWILGEWSSCSNTCGSGTQTRSVLCQSGFIEDCPKPMPETETACSSTQLCSWEPSTLTECSTTCGAGTQTQSWSCPSGNVADCGSEPAPAEVSCYATSGCVWLTLDWGLCSNQCGYGTRERNVTCSGPSQAADSTLQSFNRESSMQLQKPCKLGVIGRLRWGSCSASCGNGSRTREISCSSGMESDCDSSYKPAAIEDCHEVSSCQWRVSSWSACSSYCGQGLVTRSVSCESGSEADCTQPAPASQESCLESFCSWTVTEWSACNATCGPGFQERDVLCPVFASAPAFSQVLPSLFHLYKAGGCEGEGPADVQPCVGTSGCAWELGEWSSCSTSCGSGIQSRSVSCPSDSLEDCGQTPHTYVTCTSYTGCQWQVGNWSQCDGNGCGQRVRAVYCQSGQSQDCAGTQPTNITTCDLQVCTEVTSDSASFDLVLEVDSGTDVESVKDSVQEAVADSLSVDANAVSVQLVDNGRRLAAVQTLEFIVEVQEMTKGLSEFLSSESSLSAVAQDVTQDKLQNLISAPNFAVCVTSKPRHYSIADMVHGSAQTRATSLMFKLSWKMSQDAFLEQLNQLCGISKFQYNFVHLPWKQLAIVNFTRSEICDHCFQVVKQVAGIPGVCIANIQGGMHQGLEANLAYFCAKCGHKSDYNTLPLILVNGEEVPLVLACRTFVTDALLNYYSERLQAQGRMPMAGHKKGKTYQTRTRQLQMPLSYQGADKPDQHNQLNLGIPLDTEYHHTHDGASIIELAANGIAAAVQISARPDTTTSIAATSSFETAPSTAATSSTSLSFAATVGTSSSPSSGNVLEESSATTTSEVHGVVKATTSTTASTSQAFQAEEQESALGPVLGVSVAALVICGGCLVWRGRTRQLSARRVSTPATKDAWASREFTEVHLYPWDYAADKLAGMIWTSNQKVHAELGEDTQPSVSPSRISSVAQSPNAVPSETPSLSNSFGSEAGRAVAAAATQVRAVCTVSAAAAQIHSTNAGSAGDGESTRPSSGASSKSQLAQVAQATQAAQTQPSIPLPPRSSVGNVNCPEGIPAASTALRAAAMPNRDPTLAPSKSSASSKPSKIAESPPPHLRPPSMSPTSPTSPTSSSSASPSRPRNSPMVSVRVTRRAEVDSRSPQSQPSQPSQTSHLPNIPGNPGVSKAEDRRDSWEASRTPNSQTPRTDTESPPRRIPRHTVRAVASSPTSPSGPEATGRRSNSARRAPARPSECWPPPLPR
eukprot:symbB.v1.2.006157.t2/scaffold360.1/size220131/11